MGARGVKNLREFWNSYIPVPVVLILLVAQVVVVTIALLGTGQCSN